MICEAGQVEAGKWGWQLVAAHTLPREGWAPPWLSWQAALVGTVVETKGSISACQRQPQLQS